MIGIYDSGIGGLSIYNSIKKLLPSEDFIYVADKKFFPYGTQDEKIIQERGEKIVKWLYSKKINLIVIACNTSTVSAINYLRRKYPTIPIVGTVPVIKTCVQYSENGKIGVLCTQKTADSDYQKNLIKKFAPNHKVYIATSTKLVEIIENGKLEEADKEIKKILSPLLKQGVDTLALGCTHFPLVDDLIKKIVGENITVLDSSEAVARQTKRVLEKNSSLSPAKDIGNIIFHTTMAQNNFDKIVSEHVSQDVKSKLLEI